MFHMCNKNYLDSGGMTFLYNEEENIVGILDYNRWIIPVTDDCICHYSHMSNLYFF